jgi:prepilin-type N-terminal cleavage/methylation domain-containing protein
MKLMPSSADGRIAFTLIELMVVIALIAILSAMIIPEMRGTYEDALLRSTSRDLVNAFDIASSRAVSLNQLHRVRLDPKSGRYVIEKRVREGMQGDEFAPLKDVSEGEGRLDTRISIQVQRPDEPPVDASRDMTAGEGNEKHERIESISFNSDGTADAAEVVLRDRQGFRLALRINPITSRVKIVELARE